MWKNGAANGQGKFTFKSGVSVEAVFSNNKATGVGLFTDLKGPQQKKIFDINL